MAEPEPHLQLPPHSMEAEQSVLGGLLIDNAAFDCVADLVAVEDFYRGEHRQIWAAVAGLIVANQAADVITVHDALVAARTADSTGGMRYLNDLAQSVPSAANIANYARIVRQRSVCRKIISLAGELMDDARAAAGPHGDADAVIDRATLALLALQQRDANDEPRLVADLLPAWMDALQARADGVTDAVATGLSDLDRLLSGGIRPGELFVIGARPSMGKSALCHCIARNVGWQSTVLLCSLEDSDQMLVSRQVAAAGQVNLADLRAPAHARGNFWSGVSDGVDAISKLRLHVDDRPALTLSEVRRKAMQVRRRAGALGLVIVDYMQLMEGEGAHEESRAYELTRIARGLKRLAKDLACPVLLLSQLNREADKVSGPPRLDHLAESGGLEQAADIIGLLWREGRAKPRPDNKHSAQLEIVKQKNGPTGTVRLWFDGVTQRFENALNDGSHHGED